MGWRKRGSRSASLPLGCPAFKPAPISLIGQRRRVDRTRADGNATQVGWACGATRLPRYNPELPAAPGVVRAERDESEPITAIIKMMPDRFHIEIDESSDGVSAEALHLQLEQVLRFLREDTDGAESVDWKVTRASMNSPLVLELERKVKPGAPEPISRPAEQLARAFASLRRGEALGDELSPTRLLALERMASQANGVRRVRIRAGLGDAIDVDPAWASEVRRMRVERKRAEELPRQPYSTVGRLEGVNVHGSKSEFYVYDPLTDQRMRCIFPDDMLARVGRALGQRVEVSGITTFGLEQMPQSMRVETLREVPTRAGSFLERLEAAHKQGGVNLTGGLSIEAAIDEVRNGKA